MLVECSPLQQAQWALWRQVNYSPCPTGGRMKMERMWALKFQLQKDLAWNPGSSPYSSFFLPFWAWIFSCVRWKYCQSQGRLCRLEDIMKHSAKNTAICSMNAGSHPLGNLGAAVSLQRLFSVTDGLSCVIHLSFNFCCPCFCISWFTSDSWIRMPISGLPDTWYSCS